MFTHNNKYNYIYNKLNRSVSFKDKSQHRILALLNAI